MECPIVQTGLLDEIEFEVDNRLPPPLNAGYESEQDMPTSLKVLEERVTNHIKFFWIVVGFGFAWLSVISTLLYNVNQNTAGLGIGKSATQLSKAQTPDQVKATLAAIQAKAAILRVNQNAPSKSEVKQLDVASRAVSSALDKYPQYPASWQAASALVNLRSISTGPALIPPQIKIPLVVAQALDQPVSMDRSCDFRDSQDITPEDRLSSQLTVAHLFLMNCTLRLDDPSAPEAIRSILPSTIQMIQLALFHVKVIYGGGPVIPVQTIITIGCEFDFNVADSPPQQGKELLEAILSNDFDNRTMSLDIPKA